MVIAMHAPDGFLEPGVAVATAAISVAVLALALRHAGSELDDRRVPLAGLCAAFVFAAQMFNFPVASGTTGHLLGGALAAILLGPWVGALVVAIVIGVQALLFADGGLTALGTNVLNMAIVPAFAGWALFLLFRRVLPRSSSGVVAATGLASGLTVVVGAMAFSLEWLFGASAPVPFDTVFGAMVGVHALIGIGEGVLSALVVAAVMAARPDLVAGARDLTPEERGDRRAVTARTFALGALLVALVAAAVVSQFAVDDPDGLERVAEEQGFADRAGDHAIAASPFADYATAGIGDERLSLAVAGLAGVTVTLLVGTGLVSASRRRVPAPARVAP
ncbi:energy-coupling factor ABC transporter permease [Dermatobacter hominis]|uniref:energy-coupling factor ABC transporter permease n=1 Tax=Dermatobacter hominis TaxID=2884263 RepID=UPI001D0FCBF3|nr:energy-coupling factor ABC transporter permease [Dermatobacter hominis]UDY34373.1 energy-coupling factor ABC transporter permease [Dermatobacter hominis]